MRVKKTNKLKVSKGDREHLNLLDKLNKLDPYAIIAIIGDLLRREDLKLQDRVLIFKWCVLNFTSKDADNKPRELIFDLLYLDPSMERTERLSLTTHILNRLDKTNIIEYLKFQGANK